MKLTTKGRYSVIALLDLANNSNGKPVRLKEISDRQGLSLHYLEQLFRILRKNEIVKSIRGPGGGYVLNRSEQEITLFDIFKASNERMSYSGKEDVNTSEAAALELTLQNVSSALLNQLKLVTLANLRDVNSEQSDV